MTPEQRIDRNLTRICNAAGVSIAHCTEEQLAVMREKMRIIMEESYISRISNGRYATQGRDWQTTDNMSAASRVMAKRHIAALREAGLIEIESAPPRGNFVKKPL